MISAQPGNSGGRKSLDAELNLVPFIDLLSMCICFLLMTAVWLQVGTMEVKQSHGTQAAASTGSELQVKFTDPLALQLSVKGNQKNAKATTLKADSLPKLLEDLEITLKGFGDSKSPVTIGSAFVTPAAKVPYGSLVAVMDTLRKNKISNIGVVPVKGTL